MKNKNLTAFIAVLLIICLSLEQGISQGKFLVKGGPTFAFGPESHNYLGGGVGLEKQLGHKWSFSATFEYLQILSALPTLTTQSEYESYYYSSRSSFPSKVWSVNSEFRLYPKKNPLTSLEGFFIGLGLEVGQVTSLYYHVIHNYNPNSFSFRGILTYTDFEIMPHLDIGAAIPLGENLSLELSGQFKVGLLGNSRGDQTAFLPIVGKVRYAF